jgi:hypothetical protein
MQRMVILFNIMLDFDLQQTSELIGTTLNCTKVQKDQALKKLQAAISGLDD